ncbi:unnamed protein product [Parajaminaea phylloscopi]
MIRMRLSAVQGFAAASRQRATPACSPFLAYPRRHSSSKPLPGASIPPPLKGVRILDLTRILAGPYCTMLLSDLGADVIKVEDPQGGDGTRSWLPPAAPTLPADKFPVGLAAEEAERWQTLPPESAYFLSVNRGKRSITLDFRKPEALEVMHRLIAQADVVVENYLPGKLSKFGLGYEQVKKIKSDIIYASLTGYGQSGPFASSPGYDVIIAADAGLMHITGEADRPPVKIGVAMTDLTTGLYIHGAIMAALIGRGTTGQGVHIDASLFESQIASLANVASSYLVAGQDGGRHGSAHPSIVPYRVFETRDSSLMIGGGNDRQFKTLVEAMDRPELAETPEFRTNADRVANREILEPLLQTIFSTQSNEYWLARLEGKLPVAPIRDIRQTFEEHPQSRARGVVTEVNHPRIGKVKLTSPAVHYGPGRMPITRPPPVLGQHSSEVLQELGYSSKDVKVLRSKGAVGAGA